MQKGLESLAFIFALPHGDPFIGGIQKSTPPPPNCPKLKLFRPLCLLTFLTFFQLCRDHFLQAFSKILRLLLLHWAPWAIAEEVHCCPATVYNIQENLFMYKSPFRPQFRPKGAPRKVFKAAENGLIVYLEDQPWAMQKEMVWYIWEEWGINVHQSTISRIVKRRGWSIKKGQRVGVRQNDELRLNWVADMLRLTAEQLVFVNESLFNETTGWRHQAYAPVGQPARYQASRTRGHCWSVLPAYTKDGYLSCTGIREGWFNGEAFFRWLADKLLPLCSPFPAPRSVIIMDNASVHCNSRIEELITSHGCQVSYLPR